MKIGIDARVLTLPELRGMGTYLEQILKFWPQKKDKFVFFTDRDPDLGRKRLPEVNADWIVVREPKGSRFHVYDWWALPRAVSREDLDVFWSPANIALPLRHVPQIVTIHDTLLQEKVTFSSRLDCFYFKVILPYLTRMFVKRVITVSNFSASRIYTVFQYPADRLTVIYNGLKDNEPFFISRQDAEDFLAIKKLPYHNFVYGLGAESTWKNTKGLIEAFSIVVKGHPELRLVISGIQQRSMEKFVKITRQLNLTDSQVFLLGFVDKEVRDALYMSCRCFVYPSLFEGFGFPPLEAMQLGTPVVASNAASIPEIVGDGAILVDAMNQTCLAKAISLVTSSAAKTEKLVLKGRKKVSQYSWSVCSSQHWQSIERLLNTIGQKKM